MANRNDIVKQARSWVGLKESNGSHKKIIDIYNGHNPRARNYKVKYTDAWCATFVSAVAIKCGATDIIPTECGCGQMIALFKKLGEWQEKDSYKPAAGDVIFYDWSDSGKGDNSGWPDHVGIVEKVSGKVITVIEGNKSDAVGRRSINVNGKFIRGYGVPKYGSSATAAPKPDKEPEKESSSDIGDIAVDGLWGCATTTKAQHVFGTEVDGIVSNQPKAYKAENPGLLSETFKWESPCTGYSPLIKAIQVWADVDEKDGRIGPKTIRGMQRKLGTGVDGEVWSPSDMVKAFQRWLNRQVS